MPCHRLLEDAGHLAFLEPNPIAPGHAVVVPKKETDHFYTAITKVDFDATDSATKAGIYLTNGNQRVVAMLYSSNNNGKKIVFKMDNEVRTIDNAAGNIVWLKVEETNIL